MFSDTDIIGMLEVLIDNMVVLLSTDSRHSYGYVPYVVSLLKYVNYVLSLNSSKFDNYVYCIFTIELEIKDTTYGATSTSFLDIHPENGQRGTRLYDKKEDFNFTIVNFPFK
jgi:hypothetical protein